MPFKKSAIALHIRLINQWIDALKSMDQKKLRFVRGNLKLFLLTASRKRHASIIALSEAFTIRVPGIPTMDLSRMHNVGVSWTDEQFHAFAHNYNPTLQRGR